MDAPADLIQLYNQVINYHRQQNIPQEECPAKPIFYKYHPIQDDNLTLKEIIDERKWWDRTQLQMPDEEEEQKNGDDSSHSSKYNQ